MTGYELTQFFESAAKWVWTAPQSQIYPLLRQMEKNGLIAGEVQLRGEKLKRTSYSLTDEGLAELRRWIAEPQVEPPTRDALLLQVLFSDLVEPEVCERVLRNHIAEQRAKIRLWREHEERLRAGDTPLLRERLAHRDPRDHRRIGALKAHVFTELVRAAEQRVTWAEEAIEILHDR